MCVYGPIVVLGRCLQTRTLIWLGGFWAIARFGACRPDFWWAARLSQERHQHFSVLICRNDKKAFSGRAAQSLLGAIAGLLFIIPGIVSDFIALTLLLPWVRQRMAGFFESHISQDFSFHREGVVIDAEAVEIVEPPQLGSNSPKDH